MFNFSEEVVATKPQKVRADTPADAQGHSGCARSEEDARPEHAQIQPASAPNWEKAASPRQGATAERTRPLPVWSRALPEEPSAASEDFKTRRSSVINVARRSSAP